jgi:hypothetical protein
MKTIKVMVGGEAGFAVVMMGANHRVWTSVKHPLFLMPDGLCTMSNSFRDLYSNKQLWQLHDSVYEGET